MTFCATVKMLLNGVSVFVAQIVYYANELCLNTACCVWEVSHTYSYIPRSLDVKTPLFVVFIVGTPWIITTDPDHVKVACYIYIYNA